MAVSDRIAVMNRGSIVQEGTAEDLYHRPASEFVATFVGRVNLVPAQVTGMNGDRVTLRALGTTLEARTGAAATLRVGDAANLVVRPEAIRVAPPNEGTLPARIVARTFLGDKIEYVVDCAGTMLQAIQQNIGPGDARPDGDAVSLSLAEGALVALPAVDR